MDYRYFFIMLDINFITETIKKTVNLKKIKKWRKKEVGGVIYQNFCYKKIIKVLYNLDTMSCTKFVNFKKK